MRIYTRVTLLLLFLLLIQIGETQAQRSSYGRRRNPFYVSVGASVGMFTYQGDLDDQFAGLKFPRPGFGAQANLHFHPHMYVSVRFAQGWIGATDKQAATSDARKFRNLSFESHITEFSAVFVYDWFTTVRHFKYRPKVTPYIYAGISVFNFNPRAQIDPAWFDQYPGLFSSRTQWVNLQPLGTEGQYIRDQFTSAPAPYQLTQIAIPLGIGLKFKLNKRLNLLADVGMRKTFTDYMDDVSNRYAPPNLLAAFDIRSFLFADRSGYLNYAAPSNSGYAANDIRGFKNQTDWYVYSSIAITVILGREDKCPKFR
jgi:hypothetical protein